MLVTFGQISYFIQINVICFVVFGSRGQVEILGGGVGGGGGVMLKLTEIASWTNACTELIFVSWVHS